MTPLFKEKRMRVCLLYKKHPGKYEDSNVENRAYVSRRDQQDEKGLRDKVKWRWAWPSA